MSNINELSIGDLKKAVVIKEKIAELEQELASLLGASSSSPGPKRKGGMSAAGRARIAAAQKKRWAIINAGKTTPTSKPAKRKMSAAGRAAISRAAKARWAKVNAGK